MACIYLSFVQALKAGYNITLEASETKDYLLKKKADKEMKKVAKDLLETDNGCFFGTNKELAQAYPELYEYNPETQVESEPIIWAIRFRTSPSRLERKMKFTPIRSISDRKVVIDMWGERPGIPDAYFGDILGRLTPEQKRDILASSAKYLNISGVPGFYYQYKSISISLSDCPETGSVTIEANLARMLLNRSL